MLCNGSPEPKRMIARTGMVEESATNRSSPPISERNGLITRSHCSKAAKVQAEACCELPTTHFSVESEGRAVSTRHPPCPKPPHP